MLLNIIAYLLLFIGAGDTFSSGLSSIAGKVIDSNTNEPVSFAYVHLEEINRTETTNQQGVFELKNINLGTYTLTVHRIGYKTQSQKITIDSETGIQLEIRMEPTIFSSRVIQVVGESAGASNLEHASKKIYGVELRRNLGSTLLKH